jgi:acyl-coenzyme A thioesterase 13
VSALEGFEPIFRTSPFAETIGPLYYRKDSDPLVLGMRILDKHTNARGFAHGGVLLTLADLALGYSMAFRENPPASLITANLSADFAGVAKTVTG